MIRTIVAGVMIAGSAVAPAFLPGSHAAAYLPPVPPAIVKYQFTYNHSGTLLNVTTQDKSGHILGYPCSPPAVSGNGNYSISCDLP